MYFKEQSGRFQVVRGFVLVLDFTEFGCLNFHPISFVILIAIGRSNDGSYWELLDNSFGHGYEVFEDVWN